MSVEIKKYPDGTSYAVLNKVEVFGEQEFPNLFTFRVNTYEDLWHLNQVVDVCNYNNIVPTIVIPNLIDAQADKRDATNKSFGLKLVLYFLAKMNAKFEIFHPHNAEIVEGIMNNVKIIDNTQFIKEALEVITDEGDYTSMEDFQSKMILMSSDAGGFKPLIKLADKINWKGETYSASKARSWDEKDGTKFVQQIDRQDFKGKDILIIDDISVYGGTFKGLSKLLRERNVGKLYLAVSHITMKNLGEDSVTNYFDKVFTTNSKFDHYYLDVRAYPKKSFPDNLEIIKLF
ncbi:MAG: hypothetical protein KC414_05500 [Romboutsia sp.]|nr:hypothetical protein [Romboutsia sp.]